MTALLIGTFLVLLIIGVPIAFAVALSGVGLTLVLLNPETPSSPRAAVHISRGVTLHGAF